MGDNLLVWMFKEPVDELYHDVHEHLALWESEDSSHQVVWNATETKRIDESKSWSDSHALLGDTIKLGAHELRELARDNIYMERWRRLYRRQPLLEMFG